MKNKYYIKQLYAKSKDLTPFASSAGREKGVVLLLTEEYKVEALGSRGGG